MVALHDDDLVAAEIKYELGADGVQYPHIYGGLNRDAIVSVLRMPRLPEDMHAGLIRARPCLLHHSPERISCG